MEPLKVHEGEFEKGVPETHEKLDCNIHKTDPQCEHEIFSDSQMIGAGHHVRAKTDTPVIGIMMQPIPKAADGHSDRWEKEFERLQLESFTKEL